MGSGNCSSSCSCLRHGQPATASSPASAAPSPRAPPPETSNPRTHTTSPAAACGRGFSSSWGSSFSGQSRALHQRRKAVSTGRKTQQLPGTGILGPAPGTSSPPCPCHVPSVPARHMLALPSTCWWGPCLSWLQRLHRSPAASGSPLPPQAAQACVHTLHPHVHPLHPACTAAVSTQGCRAQQGPSRPHSAPHTDSGRPGFGMSVPAEPSAWPGAEEGSLGRAGAAR